MKHTGSTELPPVDIEEDEFAVALAMSEAADAEADLRPDEPSGGME